MNIDISQLITGRQQLRVRLFSEKFIAPIVSGLNALITEPTEILKQWEFHFPKKFRKHEDEADSGLICKSGNGKNSESKDNKYFFQYRKKLLLEQLIGRGVKFWPHATLLAACDSLLDTCSQVSEQIITQLDFELPELQLLQRLNNYPYKLRHTLRILSYKPGYQVMAKPHSDKSFLTLHVAESRPGMYFMSDKKPIEVKSNIALGFFGMKASVVSNGGLRTAPHYVHNEQINEPRWSIVCFTHIDTSDIADDIQIRELVRTEKTSLFDQYLKIQNSLAA